MTHHWKFPPTLLLCIVLSLLCCSTAVFGQSRPITGKVVANENDSTLPGVTVSVKGKNINTVTGRDGSFSLSVPPNSLLVFSSVGFVPQVIPVNNTSTFSVRLVSNQLNLQQVVVIGYGTAQRKDLTGAVSSISADQIEKVPVTTLDQAMQGRSAGVEVTNNDGQPGGGVQVQIRGVGSLGYTDPLYVVDGYPLSGGISNINPSDIATIDILKDASATAIYGNRASNGVVIITTKRGRKNGVQISVDANTAVQTKPKEYAVLNAQQWGQLAFQHAAIDGYTALANWADADTLHEADWQNAVYQTGVRQQYNVAIRGGSERTQTSISAAYFDQKGIVLGSEYKRYSLGANVDYNATNWLKSVTSLKYTRLNSVIPFGTGGQGAGSGVGYLSKLPPTLDGGNLITPLIKQTIGGMVNYGFFNPNNQAVRNWGSGPEYLIETQDQQNRTDYLLGTTSLEATILPGLRVKTNFGINISDFSGYYFTPSDTREATQYGTGTQSSLNYFSQNSSSLYEWVWENTVAYTKTFGLHKIDAVGGISAQHTLNSYIGGAGTGLASNALRDLAQVATITNVYGNQNITTLESQFGRINYTYADKYLLTATIRRDGSSKFAPGNQYGIFPSGSVAWRAKQESFMQGLDWLSDLKVRASYGQIGNQLGIAPFQYLSLYSSGPSDGNVNSNGYPFGKVYQPGLVLAALPNPNLKWETSDQTDIGVDAAFLNGRLTVTADYYRKESRNFLLNIPVPAQTGFTSAERNVGSILNDGVEFAATYSHTAGGGFHYNVGFNITTVHNELLSLASGESYIYNLLTLGFPTTGTNNWGTYSISQIGKPVGEFYGYKSAGIFQSQKQIDALNAIAVAKYGAGNYYEPTQGPAGSAIPGDRYFKDINNQGRITPDSSQTALGSPIPKFFGGATFDATYKNWDFSVFLYGTYGNKIYNYQERTLESFGSSTGSVGLENIGLKYYENAWTPQNGNNRYAQIDANEFNANSRPSDAYVENGSYLRLRNLTIGYTVPWKTASDNFKPRIRLYVTAQNLFTITKYTGLDPEIGQPLGTDPNNPSAGAVVRNVTASGIDVGTYPNSRYYTIGFNVTF
jgi:TonB-dependent starch-binding outer membrane protein SusC